MKTLDPDWILIGIQPKMLDPDQMNTDPKHWKQYNTTRSYFGSSHSMTGVEEDSYLGG